MVAVLLCSGRLPLNGALSSAFSPRALVSLQVYGALTSIFSISTCTIELYYMNGSRAGGRIACVVGEKLNMGDIGTSWYPKGKSVANRALLGAGLEVGGSTAALGVLPVEAESKLMGLNKYRGARAGGASDDMGTTCAAFRTGI